MINTFLYMTFYALMKMLHRERVHLFVWLLVVVSISTWVPNLSFSPALYTALDINVAVLNPSAGDGAVLLPAGRHRQVSYAR